MKQPCNKYWILVGREVVPATFLKWTEWTETGTRHVACDYLQSERYGTIRVSTVCLGIDHSFGCGEPILFETMVFREKGTDKYGMPPPDDLVCSGFWGEMHRYHTYDEAEAGHTDILTKLSDSGCTPVRGPLRKD